MDDNKWILKGKSHIIFCDVYGTVDGIYCADDIVTL